MTRRLNSALGSTLVASLAGANDPTASNEWARAGGSQPGIHAVARLRCADEQWRAISDTEGEHVARVWFVSANPWLGDDTPVNAIRHDKFQQVAAAARALADGSFNG